jgi:hypothetical protein
MSSIIRSFKLVSGEEVVAEVLDAETKVFLTEKQHFGREGLEYKLRRPHVLQFQPIGPGKMGLAFVPWVLSNPEVEEVTIFARNVIGVPVEPSEMVQRQFLQQTSGLALASGNLVQG